MLHTGSCIKICYRWLTLWEWISHSNINVKDLSGQCHWRHFNIRLEINDNVYYHASCSIINIINEKIKSKIYKSTLKKYNKKQRKEQSKYWRCVIYKYFLRIIYYIDYMYYHYLWWCLFYRPLNKFSETNSTEIS